MTEQFEKYLEKYIALLVGEKTEFFIAIVDVEKELAFDFLENRAECMDYETVWFERRDYAAAVRLRNNPDIRKLVLLSNDTVKMIDSLKDFVEYPVLPELQEDLWICLEAAFGVALDPDCKRILGTVLEQKQISLEDMLVYVRDSIKHGRCSAEEMTKNLYQFEFWSLKKWKDNKAPTKGQLKRMIRNSSPLQLEKRLIGGMTGGNSVFTDREQRTILRCLSKNDLQGLFSNIFYDERVERLFKGNPDPRTKDSGTEEKAEAQQYNNSYRYVIQEQSDEDVWEIEAELFSRRKNGTEGENASEEDNPLEISMQSFIYPVTDELKEKLDKLVEQINNLNFTERKRTLVETGLDNFRTCFLKAVEEGKLYTPACLAHYVESQKETVRAYFGLLALCISDDGIARRCEGSDFLSQVQNLFCKKENGRLKMPFYHPVMGLYYWRLQKSYTAYRRMQASRSDSFSQKVILALVEKEQMDFPIRYMLWEGKLFQLDYTSLGDWGTEVVFGSMADYTAGSWSNIRLLNEDLMDYIARHRFLSEIHVTAVDLNDISEIMFMLEKLQRLPDSESCMVHRVILNIISEKEEELKKKLSEFMEMDIDNPQVLFRFTRELYWRDNGYDLEKIIRDSDLLFLADSSILYQKPRLMAWDGEGNWFRAEMGKMGAEQLTEQLLNQRQELPELLWDSIHHIEFEEETKLACWKTRELKLAILDVFRKATEASPQTTIVVMSSNQQILQHIYYLSGFQARKSIVPGQEMMLLNFHQESRRRTLHQGKEATVRISLNLFLEEFLGDSETDSVLYVEDGREKGELYLTFCYKDNELKVFLEICEENPSAVETDRIRYYKELAANILSFACNNYRFKEKLITMFYEQADSYEGVLMVDYVERMEPETMESECIEKKTEGKFRRNTDIVSVQAFRNMLGFIRKQASVDEYTASCFGEFYEKQMLAGCLQAEKEMGILERETKEKIEKLYRMMENTDE